MRKFIITAALLSVAAAAPAAAQDYGRGGYGDRGYVHNDWRGGHPDQQLRQIADRIERLRDRRQLSRVEANRLLRQVDQIDRLSDRYERDGLSGWERQDIQRRIQYLRTQVRWERNDDRYGNDRRDHDDRYYRR